MDIPNFAAMFGGTPTITNPPGTSPPGGPWIYLPQGGEVNTPPGGVPPTTVYTPNADYSKTLDALSKSGFAVGRAGRQIGEYRTNKALGKETAKIARQEAFQKTMEGLKAASRARAVTGAQGRTGAGSPLLAELSSIQAASTDARNRLYQGNIEKFGFDQRAKKNLYGGAGDILEALLAGSSIFKET
jgi:hypothetical protein